MLPDADSVALRPSGDLAAVARRGTVQLVAPDGTVVRALRGHHAPPRQVVIAGDNRSVVACASWFGSSAPGPDLVVYDLPTGERPPVEPSHPEHDVRLVFEVVRD